MTTKTRHIGHCAACDGRFKVRDGKLVHHGYKRPGYGYIVGDCLGALSEPHELSPAVAKLALAQVRAWRARLLAQAQAAEGALAADPPWAERGKLESSLHGARSGLRLAESEQARLSALVDGWKRAPLTEVTEVVAAQRAAKAEREQARVERRRAKLNKAVASYQKRIDSALRTRNSNVLSEIWEGCQRKLPDIDSSLSRADALALVDRDHVWAAFGLGGHVLPFWKERHSPEGNAIEAILRAMRGWGDTPWPAGL